MPGNEMEIYIRITRGKRDIESASCKCSDIESAHSFIERAVINYCPPEEIMAQVNIRISQAMRMKAYDGDRERTIKEAKLAIDDIVKAAIRKMKMKLED